MADDIADGIIQHHARLEGIKTPWNSHWQEIALRILPRQAEFFGHRPQGDKRNELIFDATAELALDRFAAALEGMLVPSTQRWHGLLPEDESLADDPQVLRWCDAATDVLFRERYHSKANFTSQIHESFLSLGAFGSQCLWVDERRDGGIFYKSVHLAEICIEENNQGLIDKVYRKFCFTGRQAAQQWGYDALPQVMKDAIEKDPNRKFDFIHALMPNEDLDPARKDWRGMPYSSIYISCEGRQVMSQGGYHTMPLVISRYVTSPREIYGRSPAMMVLPDIKMVNEMYKSMVKAAHWAVQPPYLLYDDGNLSKINLKPNGVTAGGLNRNGQHMIQPLQSGARLDVGDAMLQAKRETINDAFLVTLFQILVDTPRMTATEVLERAREKGILLSPGMGRQQTELCGPIIERELDIHSRAGRLPPMPPQLARTGGAYRVVYDSPLTRSQKAESAVGILRSIEALAGFAQYDPSVLSWFNPQQVVKTLVDANGVPPRVVYTAEEKQALDAQKQQAAQLQQLMQAMPAIGQTAKDLAQAHQAAGDAIV